MIGRQDADALSLARPTKPRQHHGEKLVTGAACQLWLEAEDRWVEGASLCPSLPSPLTCIHQPKPNPEHTPSVRPPALSPARPSVHPWLLGPPPSPHNTFPIQNTNTHPTPQSPDATVQAVTVTAVPNTDLVLRKCRVAYHLSAEDKALQVPYVVEEEVTTDRLRLVEEQVKGACVGAAY